MNREAIVALPQSGGWIEVALADQLKRMVGFRNIVAHDDQALQLPITVSLITGHLDEFLRYSQAVLLHDAAPPDSRLPDSPLPDSPPQTPTPQTPSRDNRP